MAIASGKNYHPLRDLMAGGRSTWFLPSQRPVSDRKKWIAGQLQPAGKVHIDAGAELALKSGNSLLCSGVLRIEGNFSRGDTVAIVCENREIGRGLIGYQSEDAKRVQGMTSEQIAEVLGVARRTELIHRDDLALE